MQARQHLSWTDLDEDRHAFVCKASNQIDVPDRTRQLLDEVCADIQRIRYVAIGDAAQKGDPWRQDPLPP